MNLDNYILELLQEAAEKQINVDPASVAHCLKKWNETLQTRGSEEGVEAVQLTKEQVEGAVRNFIKFVSGRNQFQFGFFMPEIYTFGCKAIVNEQKGKSSIFKDAGLQLSSTILNYRFSPLERILKTNPVVLESLKTAIANNEPKFVAGKVAKRDENGEVKLVANSKGKMVPESEVDYFEYTRKGQIALNNLTKKMEALQPFIDVLSDIKNYGLDDIKFLLDQYSADSIETQAAQIQRRPEFQIRPYSPEYADKARAELDAGLNLVFTSEDGKTKIYAIKDQADAIKAGYVQVAARQRMENLIRNKIVDSDGENMGSQWCVTQAQKNNSFYSGYRQHSTYSDVKDYTFYLVMNDHLDFYTLSDEELAKKPADWRKLSNLKFYLNMFCIQPKTHSAYEDSRVRVSVLNNPGEPKFAWSDLEKKFPGITAGKDVLVTREFSADEMIGGEQSVGYNENSSSDRFIGAQSQAIKRTYIQGPYNEYRQAYANPGTITNPEVWRSLDKASKKMYFELADANNYLDMYKSAALFEEIKSDPQTYKDMTLYVTKIHAIPGGMEKIKKNILNTGYVADIPYRVSDKNPDIQLLQKRNSSGLYNLFDLKRMERYEKDGVEYDKDYQRDKTMLITTADQKNRFIAERFNSIRGANSDDTFWSVNQSGSKKLSFLITDREFQKLIDDGMIHQVEVDVNGKKNVRDVIDDPDAIYRQQDIDEMKKGLK